MLLDFVQFTVVGVHSAKFYNEKDLEAIRNAVLRYNITCSSVAALLIEGIAQNTTGTVFLPEVSNHLLFP